MKRFLLAALAVLVLAPTAQAAKLSIYDAQRRVDTLMSNRFGSAYDYGSRINRSGDEVGKVKPCRRLSSSRVRCYVQWFAGDVVWRGHAVIRRKRGTRRHRYVIRRINSYCQIEGGTNCVAVFRGRSR